MAVADQLKRVRLLPSVFELAAETTGLVLLNRRVPGHILQLLWAQASVRLCADGGANRLHDCCADEQQRRSLIPDALIGDFDSVRPEVVAYYQAAGGVKILKSQDQDTTDLVKCLQYIAERHARILTVIVVGAFGGRFDQQISAVQAMYQFMAPRPVKVDEQLQEPQPQAESKQSGDNCPGLASTGRFDRVVLAGAGNTAELILPGSSVYRCHPEYQPSGTACGLLPLSGPAVVSTQGLVWDIADWRTEFGGQVSTNNLTKELEVRISTNHPVVWCAELQIPAPEQAAGAEDDSEDSD